MTMATIGTPKNAVKSFCIHRLRRFSNNLRNLWMDLRLQQQLAGRLSSLEIAMSLGGVSKGIDFVNSQLEVAVDNRLQNIPGTPFEFFTRGGVVSQSRPCDEERPLL